MSNKDNNKKENLDQLQELIRRVDKIVKDRRVDDLHFDTNWFTSPDIKKRMYETNPECFVSITVPGYNPALLPICNRSAIQDPEIISTSMKVVKQIYKMGKCDQQTKDVLLAKLQKLHSRLDKENPNPYRSSAKKARLTRFMNKMKKQVEQIKNQ
ncbi:MAG: hypothetical protein K9L74_05630 [Candidatus Izimaplasma sp.]|nr:hypothetical protein [Candidatus Izimaplasma bacterium]